jgi:hypothetical protein
MCGSFAIIIVYFGVITTRNITVTVYVQTYYAISHVCVKKMPDSRESFTFTNMEVYTATAIREI